MSHDEGSASRHHVPLDRVRAELRELRDRDREERAIFEETMTSITEDFAREIEAQSDRDPVAR